jgi:hypothetical protein
LTTARSYCERSRRGRRELASSPPHREPRQQHQSIVVPAPTLLSPPTSRRYGTTFDGSYFGELPFLFSECIHRQPFEVRAASTVLEGYALRLDQFKKTLEFFPDLLPVMKLVAEQRLKKLDLEHLIPTDVADQSYLAGVAREKKTQEARIMELEDLFMGQTQERRNNLKRQSTVANNVEAMQRRRELAELVEGQEE